MKTLMILALLLSSTALQAKTSKNNIDVHEESLNCKDKASAKGQNAIAVCGVGISEDSLEKARDISFNSAKKEFNRICNADGNCRKHVITVRARNTDCRVCMSHFVCTRVVDYYIGRHWTEEEEAYNEDLRMNRETMAGMAKIFNKH